MTTAIADASPILRAARLRLVPFDETHLTPRYVAWLNDPVVTRYSEQRHVAHTLDTCRAYWQSFQDTPHHFWAIVAHDAALGHIGNMNAYVDEENGSADVGILIGERAAWGQGYGREAWEAVCRHLLFACGLRRITAGTLRENASMLRILRRAGMRENASRARQVCFEGRMVDVVYFVLTREQAARNAIRDATLTVPARGGEA